MKMEPSVLWSSPASIPGPPRGDGFLVTDSGTSEIIIHYLLNSQAYRWVAIQYSCLYGIKQEFLVERNQSFSVSHVISDGSACLIMSKVIRNIWAFRCSIYFSHLLNRIVQ